MSNVLEMGRLGGCGCYLTGAKGWCRWSRRARTCFGCVVVYPGFESTAIGSSALAGFAIMIPQWMHLELFESREVAS